MRHIGILLYILLPSDIVMYFGNIGRYIVILLYLPHRAQVSLLLAPGARHGLSPELVEGSLRPPDVEQELEHLVVPVQ